MLWLLLVKKKINYWRRIDDRLDEKQRMTSIGRMKIFGEKSKFIEKMMGKLVMLEKIGLDLSSLREAWLTRLKSIGMIEFHAVTNDSSLIVLEGYFITQYRCNISLYDILITAFSSMNSIITQPKLRKFIFNRMRLLDLFLKKIEIEYRQK